MQCKGKCRLNSEKTPGPPGVMPGNDTVHTPQEECTGRPPGRPVTLMALLK